MAPTERFLHRPPGYSGPRILESHASSLSTLAVVCRHPSSSLGLGPERSGLGELTKAASGHRQSICSSDISPLHICTPGARCSLCCLPLRRFSESHPSSPSKYLSPWPSCRPRSPEDPFHVYTFHHSANEGSGPAQTSSLKLTPGRGHPLTLSAPFSLPRAPLTLQER